MRAMRLLLGFAASSAFIGAIAAGCGSSSSPSNPVDSGSGDVTTEAMPMPEAAPETGPDVVEAATSDACVPDAAINLMIPEGGLGDGGAVSPACVSCLRGTSSCQQILADCNMSCACVSAFDQFYACLGMPGGSFTSCAMSNSGLLSSLPAADQQTLFACGLTCASPCGVTLPSDGGEGGTEGGGEGGNDSGGG